MKKSIAHRSFMRRRGFTLIELLVVVSIIAILTAIGLSTFANSRNKALDAKTKAEVKQAQSAMEANVSDTTGFYADLAGTMFETGSIPANVSISYVGAAGARTGYCIMSTLLKVNTAGNCSGSANGICTFVADSTRFCAQNLR